MFLIDQSTIQPLGQKRAKTNPLENPLQFKVI